MNPRVTVGPDAVYVESLCSRVSPGLDLVQTWFRPHSRSELKRARSEVCCIVCFGPSPVCFQLLFQHHLSIFPPRFSSITISSIVSNRFDADTNQAWTKACYSSTPDGQPGAKTCFICLEKCRATLGMVYEMTVLHCQKRTAMSAKNYI